MSLTYIPHHLYVGNVDDDDDVDEAWQFSSRASLRGLRDILGKLYYV